ncbi:MAG: right-handed parallel beta-helix repeat-containing protein, partial [Candidatus Kerfeldbacteria bacterium]|nr:right-handed parallel beta-helix repeat-containing protein [Candidatus Kerfeldbacteria bacterium]
MDIIHQKNLPRRTFVIAAILMIGGLLFVSDRAAPATAQTVINLTNCQTISSSGSYRLANDVSGGGWCFSIRASNVTFDGNGKTITSSSGEALEVAHYSGVAAANVTISNFSSTGGVRTYGDTVNHVTFENLTVSDIVVFGSDDVTIRNNTIGSGGISVNDSDNDWHPFRPTITGNNITGLVGHTTKILLEIVGGKFHPCPRIDAVITGNTVNNYRNDPPPEATAGVRIRCATHSTFRNNTVRQFGTTIGLYMRDESDDGLYENNTFWVNDQEAIRIASGNDDKSFPARNLFRNNLFRSDTGLSTYFQGIGADNRFEYNVFWSGEHGFWNQNDGNVYDHNTFYVTESSETVGILGLNEPNADTWTNNILSVASGPIFGYDAPWTFSRYIGNHNLFQNRSGSVSFGNPGGSLAAWRSASGNTDDMNSLEADPL